MAYDGGSPPSRPRASRTPPTAAHAIGASAAKRNVSASSTSRRTNAPISVTAIPPTSETMSTLPLRTVVTDAGIAAVAVIGASCVVVVVVPVAVPVAGVIALMVDGDEAEPDVARHDHARGAGRRPALVDAIDVDAAG